MKLAFCEALFKHCALPYLGSLASQTIFHNMSGQTSQALVSLWNATNVQMHRRIKIMCQRQSVRTTTTPFLVSDNVFLVG